MSEECYRNDDAAPIELWIKDLPQHGVGEGVVAVARPCCPALIIGMTDWVCAHGGSIAAVLRFTSDTPASYESLELGERLMQEFGEGYTRFVDEIEMKRRTAPFN